MIPTPATIYGPFGQFAAQQMVAGWRLAAVLTEAAMRQQQQAMERSMQQIGTACSVYPKALPTRESGEQSGGSAKPSVRRVARRVARDAAA